MQKNIAKILLSVSRNKYLLVLSVFSIWLIFFDNNNLIIRKNILKEARQLRNDCEYYRQRIKNDSTRLSELMKDAESLEKFAREQYLMKRENEDIFIITGR